MYVQVCEDLKITSQNEKEKLALAKDQVYLKVGGWFGMRWVCVKCVCGVWAMVSWISRCNKVYSSGYQD